MELKIPEGKFDAYLFDCDGTIADSMPVHYLAWRKALSRWNCEFSESLFYEWAGTPIVGVVEKLNQKYSLSMPAAEVARLREECYFEYLPDIQPIAEVVEHIHAQHGQIPLAVVSGSPRESVIKTLTILGLLDRFDIIVGAEDYQRGKPAPDAFLLAARKLGVDPAKCLVFEDADLGVDAAKAAGMAWVKIAPPWERNQTG